MMMVSNAEVDELGDGAPAVGAAVSAPTVTGENDLTTLGRVSTVSDAVLDTAPVPPLAAVTVPLVLL